MATNYDMEAGSPASGGIEAPAQPRMTGPFPEDTPNISTPTLRPQEPITAGLGMGAGPGREALTGFDPRAQETALIAQKWSPILDLVANDPETPDSVRILARYIKGYS